MVTPEVRPKTTPGQAPRGRLTYVAILAFVIAAALLILVIVRPILHSQAPPHSAYQGGASAAAPAGPGSSS